MSIGARIKKVAKGLSAQQAADAFVRALENPAAASPAQRNKADEFEATVEAMFLMAAVDGDLSPEELSQLAASIDAFTSIDGKPSKQIDTPKLLLAMNDKPALRGRRVRRRPRRARGSCRARGNGFGARDLGRRVARDPLRRTRSALRVERDLQPPPRNIVWRARAIATPPPHEGAVRATRTSTGSPR